MSIKTLSGANTVHRIYGICYQNISPRSSESIMYSSSSNSGDINLRTLIKRKRKSGTFTKVAKKSNNYTEAKRKDML